MLAEYGTFGEKFTGSQGGPGFARAWNHRL